jgi:hypothetical protein
MARRWCQPSLNYGKDTGFQKLRFATPPKKYQVENTDPILSTFKAAKILESTVFGKSE